MCGGLTFTRVNLLQFLQPEMRKNHFHFATVAAAAAGNELTAVVQRERANKKICGMFHSV